MNPLMNDLGKLVDSHGLRAVVAGRQLANRHRLPFVVWKRQGSLYCIPSLALRPDQNPAAGPAAGFCRFSRRAPSAVPEERRRLHGHAAGRRLARWSTSQATHPHPRRPAGLPRISPPPPASRPRSH
jgi:hypothetical protein